MAEKILIALTILFIFEQIFYWFLGSYPYRYGILIRKIPVSNEEISNLVSSKLKHDKLTVKTNKNREEIYLRYRYPIPIIGPLLFVGQLEYKNSRILKLRIGFLSALFVLYLLLYPLFLKTLNLYRLMNSFIIILIVVWFYFRFVKSIGVTSMYGDIKDPVH